ncbi:hypothetical protein HDU67_001179 [Dinochytrium kinnereticum]|nr:hypothetical protein HDU67_001179 [Dinochytrium kinnereticum]
MDEPHDSLCEAGGKMVEVISSTSPKKPTKSKRTTFIEASPLSVKGLSGEESGHHSTFGGGESLEPADEGFTSCLKKGTVTSQKASLRPPAGPREVVRKTVGRMIRTVTSSSTRTALAGVTQSPGTILTAGVDVSSFFLQELRVTESGQRSSVETSPGGVRPWEPGKLENGSKHPYLKKGTGISRKALCRPHAEPPDPIRKTVDRKVNAVSSTSSANRLSPAKVATGPIGTATSGRVRTHGLPDEKRRINGTRTKASNGFIGSMQRTLEKVELCMTSTSARPLCDRQRATKRQSLKPPGGQPGGDASLESTDVNESGGGRFRTELEDGKRRRVLVGDVSLSHSALDSTTGSLRVETGKASTVMRQAPTRVKAKNDAASRVNMRPVDHGATTSPGKRSTTSRSASPPTSTVLKTQPLHHDAHRTTGNVDPQTRRDHLNPSTIAHQQASTTRNGRRRPDTGISIHRVSVLSGSRDLVAVTGRGVTRRKSCEDVKKVCRQDVIEKSGPTEAIGRGSACGDGDIFEGVCGVGGSPRRTSASMIVVGGLEDASAVLSSSRYRADSAVFTGGRGGGKRRAETTVHSAVEANGLLVHSDMKEDLGGGVTEETVVCADSVGPSNRSRIDVSSSPVMVVDNARIDASITQLQSDIQRAASDTAAETYFRPRDDTLGVDGVMNHAREMDIHSEGVTAIQSRGCATDEHRITLGQDERGEKGVEPARDGGVDCERVEGREEMRRRSVVFKLECMCEEEFERVFVLKH